MWVWGHLSQKLNPAATVVEQEVPAPGMLMDNQQEDFLTWGLQKDAAKQTLHNFEN